MRQESASALIILAQSGLLVALSVPLIRGSIGPNSVYGVRTRKSLSSPEIWYRSNRLGGRALFAAGAATASASLLVLAMGERLPKEVALALPVGTLLASIIAATAYSLRALAKV